MALENPQTPLLKALNAIIEKATDEDKTRRYQRIQDLHGDIKVALESTVLAGETGAAPAATGLYPGVWIAVAAVLFLLAGASVYYWTGAASMTSSRVVTVAPRTPPVQNQERLFPPFSSGSMQKNTDGGIMVKVDPGGGLKPFHASSTLVTFQQYVQFLNKVQGLQVVDGTDDTDPERAGAPFVEVDKEWLADPTFPTSGDTPAESLSHVIQWSAGDNQEPPASLYPWEAFKDVGFRTIQETTE